MVVMVTSTHLVSEICTDIASCPPYTTKAETSVVYVTATTTICSLSSTPPGYPPPVLPSSVTSSVYSTDSAVISGSVITGSYVTPSGSEYPSGSVPPQTSIMPTVVPSSSAYDTPSIVIPQLPSSSGPVPT